MKMKSPLVVVLSSFACLGLLTLFQNCNQNLNGGNPVTNTSEEGSEELGSTAMISEPLVLKVPQDASSNLEAQVEVKFIRPSRLVPEQKFSFAITEPIRLINLEQATISLVGLRNEDFEFSADKLSWVSHEQSLTVKNNQQIYVRGVAPKALNWSSRVMLYVQARSASASEFVTLKTQQGCSVEVLNDEIENRDNRFNKNIEQKCFRQPIKTL